MDENVLADNFSDVVNKSFDQDMGFGYISDSGYLPKPKVILQGRNPFTDNHSGTLSPMLGEYLPYSQVYHLALDREGGVTYCILRHYLHIPSLTQEEVQSIKVVACSVENLSSMKIKEEKI